MFGILIIVACIAYLDAANEYGTAHVQMLHPVVVQYDHRFDMPAPTSPVMRFGYSFGSGER